MRPPALYRSRQLAEDPVLNECLYLTSKSIPFDVAFSLDPYERLAWIVVLGSQKGAKFNWDTLTWERPDA